jgi:hypothetical protein
MLWVFFLQIRAHLLEKMYQIARGLKMPVQIWITMFRSVPTLLGNGILSFFVQLQSSLRDFRCIVRHLNKFCGMKRKYE